MLKQGNLNHFMNLTNNNDDDVIITKTITKKPAKTTKKPEIRRKKEEEEEEEPKKFKNEFLYFKKVPNKEIQRFKAHYNDVNQINNSLKLMERKCFNECSVKHENFNVFDLEWISCGYCNENFHRRCILTSNCWHCNNLQKEDIAVELLCPICSCISVCALCNKKLCYKNVKHEIIGNYLLCLNCVIHTRVKSEQDIEERINTSNKNY